MADNIGKLNRIRETNSAIVQEIESLGGSLELLTPRMEHFMAFLVQIGVVTEEQLIEECIAWEHNLKEQLVPIVQRVRQQRQEAQDQLRKLEQQSREKAKQAKLDTQEQPPNVHRLIIPPGAKRGQDGE